MLRKIAPLAILVWSLGALVTAPTGAAGLADTSIIVLNDGTESAGHNYQAFLTERSGNIRIDGFHLRRVTGTDTLKSTNLYFDSNFGWSGSWDVAGTTSSAATFAAGLNWSGYLTPSIQSLYNYSALSDSTAFLFQSSGGTPKAPVAGDWQLVVRYQEHSGGSWGAWQVGTITAICAAVQGDADLDGDVDQDDYNIVSANYNAGTPIDGTFSAPAWVYGDFNGDGTVSYTELAYTSYYQTSHCSSDGAYHH